MAEKNGSGCLKIFLIVLLIFLILIIGVPFLITSLAVGSPLSYPAPTLDSRDKSTMANVITRLARSLVDKEGRVVETAVLTLSPDEVQTLVNAAIRSTNRKELDSLPYNAIWDNGHLRAFCSMPLSTDKAANLYIEVTPVVDKGQLTLIPGRGKVGRLPLPRAGLHAAADKLAMAAMGNESVRTALSAFTSIEPGEDGTLVLMFDPRDVNTVVRILRSAGEERDGFVIHEDDREDEEDEEEEWEEEEEEEWEEMEELEEDEDDPAERTDEADAVETDGGDASAVETDGGDANAVESDGKETSAVESVGGDADTAQIQPVL